MKNKLSFSLFVYFFILVFLALGTWQIIRLNWKLELINSIEQSLKSEPIEFNGSNPTNFKKIKFEGILDNSKIIYLYSLSEKGEPGFDIVNPISINNKSYLINRGWIPRDFKSKKYFSDASKFEGILKLKSKFNYFKPDNDLKREISLSASMNYEKYIFENSKIGVAYYGFLSSQNTLSLGGNAFYKMNF